jgi:geranylgeranyl diphosphate synthase, type I
VLPTPPASLLSVARRVEARLAEVMDAEHRKWSEFDPLLATPFTEMRRLVLAGGKRLRPAFCQWGYVGLGGNSEDQLVVDAGAALELLHAFALFHDDIMDGSATRRGEPTTHTLAIQQHETNGYLGEARRFGEGVAILVGDLTYVYADELMMNAPPQAWAIWNALRIELNIGQYLDVLGSATRERRRDRTERICQYKSAKYTIERPLHLGATMALPTIDAESLAKLSAYGVPLGEAFQMRDDVLGAFGETDTTGKPVGDDLREGKPTPLLSIATSRATPAQLAVLDRVGRPEITEDEIRDAQQVIKECGALDELEDHITSLTASAVNAIKAAPITTEARDELIELAAYVSWRAV